MVIKRTSKLIFVGLCIILFSLVMIPHNYPLNQEGFLMPKDLNTSDPPLVEKIFPFFPNDSLLSLNLTLEHNFMYYIWTEIVTPHHCNLSIRIIDPDNITYDIAFFELDYDLQGKRAYEIPFGSALSGRYTFHFNALTEENLNIFIQIQKEDKVFFDKITPENRDNLLVYNTTRFYHGMYTSHKLLLKSDYIYKMFVGRVSPISETITGINDTQVMVRINYSIIDPYDNVYIIFKNEVLQTIDALNISTYGTYCQGIHTFNLSVRFSPSDKIEAANIGHAINQDYKKGSIIIPPNETEPVNSTPPVNETIPPSKIFHIPKEWTTGFFVFTISLVAITIMLIIRYRDKGKVGLPS